MTAADGKKTQECIHTMSEPCESAWPSQNMHGGAVAMAPPPNPGGGPAAGKNGPQGGVEHTARLQAATGGWEIPVATWWDLGSRDSVCSRALPDVELLGALGFRCPPLPKARLSW